MRGFYYIALLLLLMGCSNSTEKRLASNPTITAVFEQSEIKDLAVILDFFNDHICALNNAKGYQLFFEKMAECEKTGSIDVEIPLQDQLKMYSRLSEPSFNQIWRIGQRWFHPFRVYADTIEVKELVFTGNYLKFLKAFGKDNSLIDLYLEYLESAGVISPASTSIVMTKYKQFNVKDVRIQLFIAMHYLTLNYNEVEKKKLKRDPYVSWIGFRYNTLTKGDIELK